MKNFYSIFLFFILISCQKELEVYTLYTSVNPPESGYVISSKSQYNEGEIASVVASPNDEYVFKEWSGIDTSLNPLKIEMNSDLSLIANFIKKKFSLEIEIIGQGTVEQKVVKTGSVTDYNSGTIVELSAFSEPEWKFSRWSEDFNGIENPSQLTIDKPKKVKAIFEELNLISVELIGKGSFSKKLLNYEKGLYTYEIKAISEPGWSFVKFKENDNEYFDTTIQVTVKENIELRLEFTDINKNFEYQRTDIVNSGLYGVIWGMDLIDDNKLIFTSRDGFVYVSENNNVFKLEGFPYDDVNNWGQGGLLDVKKHPNEDWIYLVYTKKNENFPTVGSNLKLIRFKLDDTVANDIEQIFVTSTMSTGGHFGSRITFDNNHLFLSLGEGSSSYGGANTNLINAQDLNVMWGKIHRINYDGTIPIDNPSFNDLSPTSIFSIGHRNPQGITYNPYSKQIMSSEHGPKGGDEINIIKKGLNYGWPYVSFGVNYDLTDISSRKHDGYEKPVYYWDPSIATSNLIFLDSVEHNSWFMNLLVCGLRTEAVHRLKLLDDNTIVELSPIVIGNNQRVRNISKGKNGDFYVSTDTGRIIKFSPN